MSAYTAGSAHLQLVIDQAEDETHACEGCARRAQALAVMEVDLANAHAEHLADLRRINLLQGQLDKALAENDPTKGLADVVFAYWKKTCRPKAREFGRARRVAVTARINGMTKGQDGLTENEALVEIFRAIDGASHDAYTKDGKAYDDLELICRDPVTLQRFTDRQERWENRTDAAIEKLIWPEGVPEVEQVSEAQAFAEWRNGLAEQILAKHRAKTPEAVAA